MTEPNTAATSELLQQATAGNAKAQFELALCYINGEGIEKNSTLALEWHEKSAEQGYVEAQFALGLYYFLGVDDRQTVKLLNKWVQAIINKKYATLVLTLAVNHETWGEFKANAELAFKWFKQAAKQNHAESKYWSGMCYQNGWGAESNQQWPMFLLNGKVHTDIK